MNNFEELLGKHDLNNKISLDDIPNIDLYMDQVIQLFDNKFNKSDTDEKILTKTMINNYAKAKLLFPIKNKKYTKKHIILMSFIYQLKGALSIKDIKDTLNTLNKKITEENYDLDRLYEGYLKLQELNTEKFKADLTLDIEEVSKLVDKEDEKDVQYLEKVLLISSLVNRSNMYRNAAENLVKLIEEDQIKS